MITRTIRINKKDSAFVYAILESLEGMAAFSTLENPVGAEFRDLKLFIPKSFEYEINSVLNSFRKKFPVVEIADSKPFGEEC